MSQVRSESPQWVDAGHQATGALADSYEGLTDWSVGSLANCQEPLVVAGDGAQPVLAPLAAWQPAARTGAPVWATIPALPADELGDAAFRHRYGLRFSYMTGAMANGIASADMVIAAAQAGCLGSYGAGGQGLAAIEADLTAIHAALGDDLPWAANLIHSPGEPQHEEAVADLFLKYQVPVVEASAYLGLTAAVVRYRVTGLREVDGKVVPAQRIIAKASRVEVATRWLSPPPAKILDELVTAGRITAEEARLAPRIAMCDDLTAEADSGGHTDNRPALCMLPTFLSLRDRLQAEFGYADAVCVGLGGGIATPEAIAAAFAMGAAFVVTGSINQACVESGSCQAVREMLAQAEQADVTMAPASDMFEMGVKLQVLKRGTMFAMRGQKLYDIYRDHASWDAVPAKDREQVEKQFLRASFADIWRECETFWAKREPRQLDRARKEPKHQMALVFRWYLGMASRWANSGVPERKMDYQVWCGPAMGAFNAWAAGSLFDDPANRRVGLVAHNLLYGAAWHLRRDAIRRQGITLSLPAHTPVDGTTIARLLAPEVTA